MSPVNFLDTKRQLLTRAYQDCKSTHVAFVDESAVVPNIATGHSYYFACAYVAPVILHQSIREALIDIAGGDYWHTSEAHRDESQRATIHDLCKYIGEGADDEGVLIAARRPIRHDDPDGELAREACLSVLLSALHAGEAFGPVALTVLEERRRTSQRNRDESTIKRLRTSDSIGRIQTHFTTPSIEPLLWVPDFVAFAQGLRERRMDFDYIDHCADKVRILEA